MALRGQNLLKEYVRNDTMGKSQLWKTTDAKQVGLKQ
jgi:chromosome segregation and condensation protein ScpB